jgi:hypothetical protein
MKRSKEKNAFMLEYMFHGNVMKHSAGRLHSTFIYSILGHLNIKGKLDYQTFIDFYFIVL